MRLFLAALALASILIPSPINATERGVRIAQMARDVSDAVRKQRAERRARSRENHRMHEETKR